MFLRHLRNLCLATLSLGWLIPGNAYSAAHLNFAHSMQSLPPELQVVAKRVKSRVPVITNPHNGGRCSGALVAPDLVLTAGHCVDDLTSRDVSFRTDHDGVQMYRNAVVVALDLKHDLAVLRLDKPAGEAALPVYQGDSKGFDGRSVFTLGHPKEGLYSASALKLLQPTDELLFFSGVVHPGNSGGPVVDASGQVLGVVVIRTEVGGERNFGDAVGPGPVQSIIQVANKREPLAWYRARGNMTLDLGLGTDSLLNEFAGRKLVSTTVAIGWEHYSRLRWAYRWFGFGGNRAAGWEIGWRFLEWDFSPAVMIGANEYRASRLEGARTAPKIGLTIELFFLDLTYFQIYRDDRVDHNWMISF